MGTLRLSEFDRKKYNLPEVVVYEPYQFGMKSIKQLREQAGLTLAYVLHQMEGPPALDEHGNVIPLLDDDGAPLLDDDGEPRLKTKQDEDAIVAFVWLALWNAGHHIPWADFDISPLGLEIRGNEDPDQGKDEPPATDSESTSSTLS